ncbi:cell division protein ZapE [Legionella sp. km772]|uniref:cell division protein ZapE n=1 Tax=Legionella sp. km772 TaxID=2498111 RepID=UPI000F8F5799|nr:cell division protein ZapE [Legionella sp. km772]RUR12993.1 cell division protein ZapE [Legionella sp. km772]
MNLLIDHYNAAIDRGEINDDPMQRVVLNQLQQLVTDLEQTKSSWFSWGKKSVKGAYIYGPVGVGKTYLVDLFYDSLVEKKKARFHFHHFMQQIDAQLRRLQGQKDPLRLIAKEIAKTTRLLCFDEFLVDDVAYAMILAELLQALVREGVILVISSNTKPDDLYAKGVQRQRFLPAIALINKECVVMHLNEQRDYRLGREPLLNAYLYPLNQATQQKMEEQFALLVPQAEVNQLISIQSRAVPALKCGPKSIWFAFEVLCNFPRSQLDYLELADRFEHIFISGVPSLTVNHTAQAIMFINFIDVMYDRGIKVIISAAVPMDELYLSGEMFESFKRTLSRLNEMQSVDYLNRHPRRVVHNILE